MLFRIAFIVSLAAPGVVIAQTAPAEVQSPDGRLKLVVRTAENRLVYEVASQGRSLIEPSGLSLELKDQPPLGPNVRIVSVTPSQADETFRLVAGKTSTVRNHYNALRVQVEEIGGAARKMEIEAKIFDDAVAFRYLVPAQAALKEFNLSKENTEFRISKDPIIYALLLPHFKSMYESEFIKMSASSLANQGGVKSSMLVGLPLLMEVPGVAWLAITEADLRDYAAMYLVNPSGSWTGHWFRSTLSPHADDPNTAVVGTLPHHSAWRVMLIAATPGKLIESNVVAALNPPAAIGETSWIRAGKASWDWWSGSLDSDGKNAFTTANMKYYVDFAAQSGFEYMLVDAGWSKGPDITNMNGRVDIPELVRYAAAKRVKVWIWLAYTGVEKQMADAFPLYEKWGVAGMKIDFIERDDQAGMDFYYRVAELAAQHHLMVDFHGSTKPTGLERTYPNVFGYEAVLGMEQSKAGSRDNPDHHVMLPFTRMLAGPMDYTPGGFDNTTQAGFTPRMRAPMVMGTRAHQLAMYAVYESPFQMVSDHPGAYKDQPGFEFIKAVPAAWDETRVLNGTPGEYVTLARRRGEEWFLGSMTNWTPRDFDFPLTFLGEGSYQVEIYADAADADSYPKKLAISKVTVNRSMRLKAHLAQGGGYAARLSPIKP